MSAGGGASNDGGGVDITDDGAIASAAEAVLALANRDPPMGLAMPRAGGLPIANEAVGGLRFALGGAPDGTGMAPEGRGVARRTGGTAGTRRAAGEEGLGEFWELVAKDCGLTGNASYCGAAADVGPILVAGAGTNTTGAAVEVALESSSLNGTDGKVPY